MLGSLRVSSVGWKRFFYVFGSLFLKRTRSAKIGRICTRLTLINNARIVNQSEAHGVQTGVPELNAAASAEEQAGLISRFGCRLGSSRTYDTVREAGSWRARRRGGRRCRGGR